MISVVFVSKLCYSKNIFSLMLTNLTSSVYELKFAASFGIKKIDTLMLKWFFFNIIPGNLIKHT